MSAQEMDEKNDKGMQRKGGEKKGERALKSVGWSINTAGIIKSPCSALCSPSPVTRGLQLSYASNYVFEKRRL